MGGRAVAVGFAVDAKELLGVARQYARFGRRATIAGGLKEKVADAARDQGVAQEGCLAIVTIFLLVMSVQTVRLQTSYRHMHATSAEAAINVGRINALIYGGAFAVNIILCVVLIPPYGAAGAAIAISTALIVETIALMVLLKKQMGLDIFVWRRRG